MLRSNTARPRFQEPSAARSRTKDVHDTQLRSGVCSSLEGIVMMRMLALAGTVIIAISAQAQAAPSIPPGRSSVDALGTLVVPVQPRPVPSCNKGYHYGFCTNPRTGRSYRGC